MKISSMYSPNELLPNIHVTDVMIQIDCEYPATRNVAPIHSRIQQIEIVVKEIEDK